MPKYEAAGGLIVTRLNSGTDKGRRPRLNFIDTGTLTWSIADDSTDGEFDIQATLGANSQITAMGITIDGGGSAIAAGVKGFIHVPYACTINSVTMLADQSGSIAVDIWKDTYANYPPTDVDSITASAVPTITTATKSQDTTLTGWTTTITAGDVLGFNVDSCVTITRLNLVLKVTKT